MNNPSLNQDRINRAAWEACDTLRGVVDPAEYKNYILVMLFLKYLSDVRKDKVEELTQKYPNDPQRVQRQLGYEPIQMPDESTFDYLHQHRGDDDIGQKINIAFTALEDANRGKLEGVFREIDFNLNIPHYVDTFEEEELVDIPTVQREIKQLDGELQGLQGQIDAYLRELGLGD